jgi:hypothetical protein
MMLVVHFDWKSEILPGGFHTWWSNFEANGYPGLARRYAVSAEAAGALLLSGA